MSFKFTWPNILTIILVAVVCWLCFRSFDVDEPIDYSGYIQEFNELQTKVENSETVIVKLDSGFNVIQQNLTYKYEKIDSSNADELPDLFRQYFSARK